MERGRPRKSKAVARNRIRDLRLARGWSLEELADRVGLNRSTVQRHERGERDVPLRRVEAYAAAFGCQARDVLPAGNDDLTAEQARANALWARLTPEQLTAWLSMGETLSALGGDSATKGKRRKR